MVEANPGQAQAMQDQGEIDIEKMTDDEFEAMAAKMPKMTPEEIQ